MKKLKKIALMFCVFCVLTLGFGVIANASEVMVKFYYSDIVMILIDGTHTTEPKDLNAGKRTLKFVVPEIVSNSKNSTDTYIQEKKKKTIFYTNTEKKYFNINDTTTYSWYRTGTSSGTYKYELKPGNAEFYILKYYVLHEI